MLILTNCLTEHADEGCIKVANSLIRRIKEKSHETMVVSYERCSSLSDRHIHLNKFLLGSGLRALLRKASGPILYIPFPSKPISSMLRIFSLALQAGRSVYVLLAMTEPLKKSEALLLKRSRAKLLVLSEEAYHRFSAIIGKERVFWLKTGVDTARFAPIAKEEADRLKIKYGLDLAKKTVLHVGHLNEGRNVGTLMALDPQYQVVLVTSTLTRNEQDQRLKEQLLACPHIRIFEDYLPEIQELYQLSDLYFFPVKEMGHCIDVPLSCLEAAACNKPVVTTAYGEMKSLYNMEGFWLIDRFEPDRINRLVEEALKAENLNVRRYVLEYDWQKAVDYLMHLN